VNLEVIIAITAAASAGVGIIGGLVAARYTWRKDRRESAEAEQDRVSASTTADREKEAADDRAADRLVRLLNEANAIAIENERMKYELKLNDEITKVKALHKRQFDEMRTSLMAEMQRQIREALDVYGCELAAVGCKNRRPRMHAATLDMSPATPDV